MNGDWMQELLRWFDCHRRDLPWREDSPRDPYRVWVSEIMLQQTRTEAVRPYYTAWMEKFPTIRVLAEAEEEDVLHQWQGLGYYSRARNLHKAAREIVSRCGGHMPEDRKGLLGLPGIGEYTAGAILSIAFGQREDAADGNVLRIYARLYRIHDDILKNTGKRKIIALVKETISPERPGDFNEALMDLGADICIPRNPRCGACPLRRYCGACAAGETELLPVRTPKKEKQQLYAACGICKRGNAFLMHLRPDTGMLASMWEFPMALAPGKKDCIALLEKLVGGAAGETLWTRHHVFTHRIWDMTAYRINGVRKPDGEDWQWITPDEYRELPLAGPHARLAAAVEHL